MTWNLPWVKDALCAQIDGDLWFPEDRGQTRESRMAKEICRRCPVIEPCGEYALRHIEFGIWAGLSHDERKKLRSQLGIKLLAESRIVHGTEAGAQAHRRRKEKPCTECAEAAKRAHREREQARRRTG